jgi:hypothetical protein
LKEEDIDALAKVILEINLKQMWQMKTHCCKCHEKFRFFCFSSANLTIFLTLGNVCDCIKINIPSSDYYSTFSALALIILFSVLSKLLKKKDFYVKKLEYSVKAVGFKPM